MAIAEEGLEGGVLISTLTGVLSVPGEYHFTCDGYIDIVEDNGVAETSEAIVTVKGVRML